MNIAAHQEKEKNEEKKMGKRKTGNRFYRNYVLPFRSHSEGSTSKKGLCKGSAQGNWDPREGQQPF